MQERKEKNLNPRKKNTIQTKKKRREEGIYVPKDILWINIHIHTYIRVAVGTDNLGQEGE